MRLTINGTPEELPYDELTVEELLSVKKVRMPETVTVELNGTVIRRHLYASTKVKDGDAVEFLYFMGGGR
ncbi:thiamine biosynthesis protein ThiS [Spirochaeta thermophila DSM 6578]|uniref:Thiamine biosynthesis protein ThiS n=1 Tax=Winmispira thermophila (strain ATCC 700085 / DSM 6578 / Z-1203) TaxID=869211 RepID=G0GBD8_WINT7|nr:sulfur carrier protein ThiS [Spirochaeta thermophila]AEJ61947.1 thiamine biosynthesis protein ThiS [Spirochaeta thermophila DSM 6578]